ncbi:TldD/PmbA family protein [Candidatus Bipolaricaulota bacterium]|nr:TldD/PmbA family protein [Candidatus Bipolaricaulota bacterium]
MNVLEDARATADQAELFSTRRKSAYVRFDDSSLALVAHRNDSACALRVLRDGKLGASFGESPSQAGLLDSALAAASFGQSVKFGFATEQPACIARTYNAQTAMMTAEDIVDLCSKLKSRIHQAVPDATINMVCQVESSSRRVETTEGAIAEEASTLAELAVELPFAHRGTDTGARAVVMSNDPIHIPDEWIAQLVEERSWGEQASSPVTGRLPVILTPATSNLLTLALVSCLSGHAVAKGISPLLDKTGQKILSDQLTIRENAGEQALPLARSFDDEGIACQRRTIVEKGVLLGFLTDLSSAANLGQPSTGNAVRRTLFSEKIEDAPTPSFLGAIIEAGSVPWRELVRSLEEGVLVTHMLGLHSSNLLQGQFSVQVTGFHIRKGKVVGYLERTMMSGNLFEDFTDIRGVSQERMPTAQGSLAVAGLAPYILLDSAQLTVG